MLVMYRIYSILVVGNCLLQFISAVDQATGRYQKIVLGFSSFITQHEREYHPGSEEYQVRFRLFSQRTGEVESLNKRRDRLWTAGINALSDWTEIELGQLRGWRGVVPSGTGFDAGLATHSTVSLFQGSRAQPLPDAKTWTNLKSFSDVQDQGVCGSCWAIVATTVLQAHLEIKSGHSQKLSSQELLNCVPNPRQCGGSGGCNGTTVELAFDWILRNGLSSEENEPYFGTDRQCDLKVRQGDDVLSIAMYEADLNDDLASPGIRLAKSVGVGTLDFGMRGWERLPENEYEPLMRAVVEHGPVAVSVATYKWDYYLRGIFNHCLPDAQINHAVTLIGYGQSKKNTNFWMLRNSWGSWWGEEGNIRLLRRDTDAKECGIDHQPEVGTGCIDGPKQVTVCGMCGILYDSVVPILGD